MNHGLHFIFAKVHSLDILRLHEFINNNYLKKARTIMMDKQIHSTFEGQSYRELARDANVFRIRKNAKFQVFSKIRNVSREN